MVNKELTGDSGGSPCLMAIRKLGLARDLLSEVRFVEVGIVHEEGPRERVFKDPTSERPARLPEMDHRGGAAVEGA